MRPYLTALALTAVMAASPASWAKDDKAFLREAIQGNLAEQSLGKLAQERSPNSEVKSYGTMLVTDHTEANAKVTSLAQQMNVKVPTQPSLKQRAMARMMKAYSTASFDRRFVDHMIKDHKKDISDYEKQSKGTGQVAELAKAALPTLQKHLDTAQALKPKLVSSNSRAKSMNTQTTTGSSNANSPTPAAPTSNLPSTSVPPSPTPQQMPTNPPASVPR
jgi:putative membrane protein